jgi:amino acid transporter
MQVLEPSGTVGYIPKTAGADHVVADQREVAAFLTPPQAMAPVIMASRVLYGLNKQGSVPAMFGRVHRLTRTPLIATGTITAVVLVLALVFPLEGLAEWTARIVLVIFYVCEYGAVVAQAARRNGA